MEHLIMYWALVVAPNDLGRVEAVYRTYEPCHIKVQEYKSLGYTAECIPTNQPEIIKAEFQLKNLALIISNKNN